jgi:predicted kinase
MLVVVCGLPGVGKTTVSEHLAEREGYDRLRTDVVRKELVEEPAYTDAEDRRVYEELFARARDRIDRDGGVVLDATFSRVEYREGAREVAAAAGVPFELVKVECDLSVVRERIEGREDDASDADFAVHLEHREAFDPIETDHVTVDNSGSMAATRRRTDERV